MCVMCSLWTWAVRRYDAPSRDGQKGGVDKKDYDSEAMDDDSDNADLANKEPDNDLDNWFKIKSAQDDPETKDEPVRQSRCGRWARWRCPSPGFQML
jgi:hypothetical protein